MAVTLRLRFMAVSRRLHGGCTSDTYRNRFALPPDAQTTINIHRIRIIRTVGDKSEIFFPVAKQILCHG